MRSFMATSFTYEKQIYFRELKCNATDQISVHNKDTNLNKEK